MWITNCFLIVILSLVIATFANRETFTSEWGGSELVWHNNLHPRYSTSFDDKIHVFNPSAYNR